MTSSHWYVRLVNCTNLTNLCCELWTGAPQLRNQVKKEAKSVVEDAYGLKNLSAVQRVSAAQFLLRYNQQGNHAIPNFVFDNVDLCWMDDDVDTKVGMYHINRIEACLNALRHGAQASTVNRKRPFQHPAIYTLIARYWFSGPRDSVIKAARDRFLEMPDNLVAFVCNAVSVS